jgi:hypothetical protein
MSVRQSFIHCQSVSEAFIHSFIHSFGQSVSQFCEKRFLLTFALVQESHGYFVYTVLWELESHHKPDRNYVNTSKGIKVYMVSVLPS